MNRLASASSSYLRSAASQPVDWHEWGEEAFDRARELDRPIFLDIGAVWCHWCHVIDRESYENPEIARLINELFVPIKVDRDERPDIDRRYQNAVSAITGSGGWPLTAFLTSKGKLFYGGTYFPPEDRGPYPGFKSLLPQIAGLYHAHRESVLISADQLLGRLETLESLTVVGGALSASIVGQVIEQLRDHFDESYGGFESQPKFPHPGAIELLLEVYYRDNDPRQRQIANRTLDGMALGGIHDQLGGGFHRYTMDRFWRVPHFEKLLHENAALLRAYLHAYEATGEPLYREVAEGIIRYVDSTLSDREQGGFYASQDADAGPRDEGGYYTWTLEETTRIFPPEEAAAIRSRFDINERGELDHDPRQNVLWVARTPVEVARDIGATEELAEMLIASGKGRLLAARAKRPAPRVDCNLYTSWNAMMISAYLEAYRVLGDESARDFALKTLDFLTEKVFRPDTGLYHLYRDGKAEVPGFLEDVVQLSTALLDAFEAVGEHHYLTMAEDLVEYALTNLWDEEGCGFFDVEKRREASEVLEMRQKPFEDAPLPGGNPLAAIVLDRLFSLTHEGRYRERAEAALSAFAGSAASFGVMASTYALAVDMHLNPPPTAVIIGKKDDPRTEELRQAALRAYRPGKHVAVYDPEAKGIPYPPAPGGEPIAYICAGMTCGHPTEQPDILAQMVESFGIPVG